MSNRTCVNAFYLPHVALQLGCEDDALALKIARVFKDLFYFQSDSSFPGTRGNIVLNFRHHDFTCFIPEEAETLAEDPLLSVHRNKDHCYIKSRDSLFDLELPKGRGTGHLGPGLWGGDPKSIQDFFMFPVLWLLRMYGVYAVHANGIIYDGHNLLIAGDSGCGKSSISLCLMEQGGSYLSDDLTLLSMEGQRVRASAFPKNFSFDPCLKRDVSGLSGLPEALFSSGKKRVCDITPGFPEQFVYTCFPEVLIFPEITERRKSEVVPLDPAETMIRLMKHSGGIMVDRAVVVRQVELLRKLASQTSSYQLFAGRDLHEDPMKITDVLRMSRL